MVVNVKSVRELFYEGKQSIEINGLIWMGDKEAMYSRIEEKTDCGFRCVKLKIGAIDFNSELELLKSIRSRYGKDEIELRVDANGAFLPSEAMSKLDRLSRYDIHSIEQPIRQGQWREMETLCRNTPIPIALDEELIGINDPKLKEQMLDVINPQYIILKPALAGGLSGSAEWIDKAEKLKYRMVDNFCSGIECGTECYCSMDGNATILYSSGIRYRAII